MTDHLSTPLTRRAIAGFAAGLLLAACSGGGAAGPSSAGAGNGLAAVGGDPVATIAAAGGGAGACSNPVGATVGAAGGAYASVLGAALCGMTNIQPCSMLKQADVEALFSVPLATTKTDVMGQCTWNLSDPSKGDGLDVYVTVGDSSQQATINGDLAEATPVSGVGDKAGWEPIFEFPHLGAIKGQATCELTIGGGDGQLSVPTSGQGVFAKIDPAALPGFIQRFGALCTQIFAGLGA
jgi:hypothetical protein